MTYPDWVLKYKKKGTYINKVGDKYYLYAAHSEHIPGTTNKSRRVCDGYLGRITEKDGFIPRKPKVDDTQTLSLEAGLSCCIVCMCTNAFSYVAKQHPRRWKTIIITSVLKYIYADNFCVLKECSYLSLFLKGNLNDSEQTEVNRLIRLIGSTIKKQFDDCDIGYFQALMSSYHMVKVKDDWFKPNLNEEQKKIIDRLEIEFTENELWQKLSKKQ